MKRLLPLLALAGLSCSVLADGLPPPLRVQVASLGQIFGKLHRVRARGVERPLRLLSAG